MDNCEVRSNCLKSYDCDFCDDYKLYTPQNINIKSPRNVRIHAERKVAKKEKKNSDASKRGKRNKRNGGVTERHLKKLLLSKGIECDKVPMSGAMKAAVTVVTTEGLKTETVMASDLLITLKGNTYHTEVKRRQGIDTYYNIVAGGDVVHIEKFCYMMDQEIFFGLVLGISYSVDKIEDLKFKKLHGFFEQDDAHIVVLKTPYKPYIFCLSEETYKELTEG